MLQIAVEVIDRRESTPELAESHFVAPHTEETIVRFCTTIRRTRCDQNNRDLLSAKALTERCVLDYHMPLSLTDYRSIKLFANFSTTNPNITAILPRLGLQYRRSTSA